MNKIFGGSSDGFFKSIKQVIEKNYEGNFPLIQLRDKLKGTNRSFLIDEEKLENILRTSYDSLDSFYVLSILFPKFNFEFKNPNIDHLHPRSQFESTDFSFLTDEEDIEFYQNHWNTILNLALLSEEQNKSKNKSELGNWIEKQEKHNLGIRNTLLIPESVDLRFENFKEFIQEREKVLKKIIGENTEQEKTP